MRSKIGLVMTFLGLATVLAVTVILVTTAPQALAQGQGQDTCPDGGGWDKNEGGEDFDEDYGTVSWNDNSKTISWDIDEGWTVEICVKEGSDQSGGGTHTFTVTGADEGQETYEHGASHVSVRAEGADVQAQQETNTTAPVAVLGEKIERPTAGARQLPSTGPADDTTLLLVIGLGMLLGGLALVYEQRHDRLEQQS